MTGSEATIMQTAPDHLFYDLSATLGLECEGPSKRGAFLVRERDGQCWLLGGNTAYGRTMLKSVWSELNIATMRQTGKVDTQI